LQIDPFEAGFESDKCRYRQNGRAGPIVTACPKYFPAARVFESSLCDKKTSGLVFIPPNLAASVRCSIPSWDSAPSSIRIIRLSITNYQTRGSSGEGALDSVIAASNGST
jgi:hypothetical protein